MNSKDKIKELQNIIESALFPLIDSDYVLLDLPYHSNYGDTLIWEGERLFLKKTRHKCLFQTNALGYNGEIFSEDTLILLHGGGNFGDIWKGSNEMRKKVIATNPKNKVIIFPQTVFYRDIVNLRIDAEFYSQYNNVIICVRDMASYDIIKNNFTNRVLLLPDMAFFVDPNIYLKGDVSSDILFVKRQDRELKSAITPSFIPDNADILDWPLPKQSLSNGMYLRFKNWSYHIDKIFKTKIVYRVDDKYYDSILREQYLKAAINFLEKYETIYSTRLHVAILSVLLEKKIIILDNNYGKVSSFYDCWLKDLNNISCVK